MAKYKVGDVVKIVDKDEFMKCSLRNSDGKMDHWAGQLMTIRAVTGVEEYYMVEDTEEANMNCLPGWAWNDTMIECCAHEFKPIDKTDLIDFLEG